ncbi:Mg/Co/Ni transporter MgtE [Methanosarcina siciliae HI350]|uniref:Mg/Co/Ni transporter MgtE n=2 Tax=Methanosarcina siciliae TaxID=38027 RepID=A0A0E3PEX0_9EURY|nr:Mg/Co/Ni transporter MgtE [Methanosarcina siciliae HI350]
MLGLRGNISSTLGSRLGSAIHMGLITSIDRNNPELTNNQGPSFWALSWLSFSGFLGILSPLSWVLKVRGPLSSFSSV